MVQFQVLAFLSILKASREASREARVGEEQKERKMAEMFYSVIMGLELRDSSSLMHFFCSLD